MSGAKPLYLSVGLILEEGLPVPTLHKIITRMAQAAREAGVTVVTDDTKVVEKGHGDGLYINTSGLGIVPEGLLIAPDQAQAGDAVLISGTLGDHGMAIMSVREGLEFETVIRSDSAPLNSLVEAMLKVTKNIHVLRDPTRGGVAATLTEIARASKVGIVLDERKLPVKPEVAAACELLGLDPLYVANEGKLVAIVPSELAELLLITMRQHPLGENATMIGEVVARHPGVLAVKTCLGATRVVDRQLGEQLPRIC